MLALFSCYYFLKLLHHYIHYDNLAFFGGVCAGAYDDEEAAARAYDLAALKYWGPGTLINFPVR